MARWPRRKKTALVGLFVLLVGGVLTVQILRERVHRYTAGERPEGLVDRLNQGEHDADHPPVAFTDVAAKVGLAFRHFPGTRSNRLPEDMGGGVALGDVNGDGWTDVFLTNATGPMHESPAPDAPGRSRLFLNRGGRFEDATEASGVDVTGLAMGAAFCDVDSDGDLDLFVTTFGACRLYRNDGAAQFVDASSAAGLDEHEGFWTGVAVGDYDGDGAVDLYVCGYVVYTEEGEAGRPRSSQYGVSIPALINPSNFAPERNLLLAGNGDGTFREVAAEAGVANPEGRSLGAVFCDLNADGHQDVYVANDVSDNALFLSRGDGTFADSTSQALVGDYRGAMGMTLGDFDGDLDLDLFITHWVAQENALYSMKRLADREDGGPPIPLYVDEADRQRLGYVGLNMVGWATRFFDLDNDGLLDLFVVNGSTIPQSENDLLLVPMRSQLFWNSPHQRGFFEVGGASGGFFAETHVGRGGATFDYDLDGDEDLLVVLHGEPAALLRNDGGNAKPCVRLRLRQETGNRYALGSRILATIGGRQRLEVLGSQGSYLSQHAVGEVAFGLGDEALVDEIEVVWPGGEREVAGPFLASTLITWTRGTRPRTEPLPGRGELDRGGPPTVAGERAFFALRKRAQEARLQGDPTRAVLLYRQALANWPGHGDCLYYLGNSLLELGQEAGALEAFERLVHFEGQSSPGWMQIGLLRLPGGDRAIDDLAAAEAAFRRCHELNGEESRPILELGVVAMLRAELDEAERHFMHAARLNPRSVEARWFAGRLAWLRGDRARAAELLAESHALVAAQGAGGSASNEGDTRAGRALLAESCIQLDPVLVRWRTLGERAADPELEYAPPE